MEFFVPRKLKFKAWNHEAKLLVRFHAIECVRGELMKQSHTLLQFTGLYDKQQEELYDMDVVLTDSGRYVVHWSDAIHSWTASRLDDDGDSSEAVLHHVITNAVRLCNYFEMKR
jgi:hypothetical protein